MKTFEQGVIWCHQISSLPRAAPLDPAVSLCSTALFIVFVPFGTLFKKVFPMAFDEIVNPRRRRGRRPLPADRVREFALTVHLSADELSAALRVAGLSAATSTPLARRRLAEFVRQLLSNSTSAIPAPLNLAAWIELARVCSNLNQLSKSSNQGRVVGVSAKELDVVRASVEHVRNLLVGI